MYVGNFVDNTLVSNNLPNLARLAQKNGLAVMSVIFWDNVTCGWNMSHLVLTVVLHPSEHSFLQCGHSPCGTSNDQCQILGAPCPFHNAPLAVPALAIM